MTTATYSPEDNKLRLYVGRVPRDEYEALRAQGWTSTPKQDCDFVATWTPAREDMALSYLADGEDIGDEDYSATERSADRAERFEGYREKRTIEAGGLADTFEGGPQVFGHQNAARAERQAARHDRLRGRACSQWGKAEYWTWRTAGVIRSALHKAKPSVRRSRILRLEAEQRKHDKSHAEYAARFAAWSKVPTLEGADKPLKIEASEIHALPAGKLAYNLANAGGCWGEYVHPRTGRKASLYSLLTDSADPITAGEAAALWLDGKSSPTHFNETRWGKHYALRLAYERAMLENEGGSAAAVEMEPGGTIGKYLVIRVHKSNTTKAVVSVTVYAPGTEVWGKKVDFQRINIQRFGSDIYKPPTDEGRAEAARLLAGISEKKKARNAGAPKLINPTREAADALQAAINADCARKYARCGRPEVFEVLELTQAQYSAKSGGNYSPFDTYYVRAGGRLDRTSRDMYVGDLDKLPIACKVRACSVSWGYRVIVLTDKPQAALPDWTKTQEPVEAALCVA